MKLIIFLTLLFSIEVFAARGGNAAKKALCQSRLIEKTVEFELMFKQRLARARPSEHGYKHTKAKNKEDAIKFSQREAQYSPDVNHAQLERLALERGQPVRHSGDTTYFFYKSDKIVGYDNGKPTYWMRAELTSGDVFHGHPMSVERVRKYLPEVRN